MHYKENLETLGEAMTRNPWIQYKYYHLQILPLA